jgi:Helix-turn-helix domain
MVLTSFPRQVPFWTQSLLEMSNSLWQPVDAELIQSKSNEDIPGLRKAALKDDKTSSIWASVRYYDASGRVNTKFDYQLPGFDVPVAQRIKKKRRKEEVELVEEELLVHRIRLSPNATQRATLKQWFGAARRVYNNVIASIQKNAKDANQKTLRLKFVHDSAFEVDNKWMLSVPYDVRDGALQDALQAFKTGIKLKKEKGKAFRLHFRSKKAPSESVYLCSRGVRATDDGKSVQLYPRKSNFGKIKTTEPIAPPTHDCRLQRTLKFFQSPSFGVQSLMR